MAPGPWASITDCKVNPCRCHWLAGGVAILRDTRFLPSLSHAGMFVCVHARVCKYACLHRVCTLLCLAFFFPHGGFEFSVFHAPGSSFHLAKDGSIV